jgi:putative phosphoserine phosphatase / 1-acylglycerol-3-phosphate O-acyltransferase
VPAASLGVTAAVLRRNRRAGVDLFFQTWLDTLFRLTGVDLVVHGEENLWKERPAVFIFNHRNNFDALMAGKLVRRDYTSVGKKEAQSNLLSAALGKLVDAVFIDRSDTASAVEALQPVQQAVANGLSLIISPEGTRSPSKELLPFKKGPFRIAMAAGVPLVPIVLRNADDAGHREATRMRPATVDALVLPPISTKEWTVDDLGDRVVGVRQQFVDALESWPEMKRTKA